MKIAKAFPDFDLSTLPAIPEGFEDTSWHNDACPSFSSERFQIWINYLDPALREHGDKYPRFSVQPMKDGIEITGDGGLNTDDWNEVLTYLKEASCPGHRDTGRGICCDCGKVL